MKSRHNRYRFDRRSALGKAAVFCLVLSVLFRGFGGLLNLTIFQDRFSTIEFALPILSSLLYLLCLLCFGRKWFKVTVFPFVLGLIACVLRLYSFDNLMQQEMSVERVVLSVSFYLILASVYSGLAFGGFRARILLFLLFLVPLAYHAVFEIYPAIRDGYILTPSLVLLELGVLSVIFAMLFLTLSLSRRPLVTEVDPESGKTVVPPVPGDRLDGKPPVVSAAFPEEVKVPEVQEEQPSPEPEQKEAEAVSSEAGSGGAAEPYHPAAPVAPSQPESEVEYDPFAPSPGPIRLTLNPSLDDSRNEKDIP